MACRSRTNKHAAVDYHEWPPRSGEPRDPDKPRRIWTESPLPQRYDATPPSGHDPHATNETRDPYGYATHSRDPHPPGDPEPYDETGYPPVESYRDYPGWSAPTSRHGYVDPAPHDFPTQARPFTGQRRYDDDASQRSDRRSDFGDTVGWVEPSHARNTGGRPAIEPSIAAHVPSRGGFDGDDRDYPAVLWWTGIWYAIPVLAYTVWTLTRSGTPRVGCTTSSGDRCASPRTDALLAVTHNLVGIALAAAISFLVAVYFRRQSLSWRAISVGFAAVVVGMGAATIIVSL